MLIEAFPGRAVTIVTIDPKEEIYERFTSNFLKMAEGANLSFRTIRYKSVCSGMSDETLIEDASLVQNYLTPSRFVMDLSVEKSDIFVFNTSEHLFSIENDYGFRELSDLRLRLLPGWVASSLGKPFVVLPQTVGPKERLESRVAINMFGMLSTDFSVRDFYSSSQAKLYGARLNPPNLIDPGFFWEQAGKSQKKLARKGFRDRSATKGHRYEITFRNPVFTAKTKERFENKRGVLCCQRNCKRGFED